MMNDEWALLKARLTEFEADPISVLRDLNDLQDRCRNGMIQEKVSAKDGVLEVLERYPAIELSVIKEKLSLFKYVEEKANAAIDNGDVAVRLEVVPLEFNPDLTESSFYDPELMPEDN